MIGATLGWLSLWLITSGAVIPAPKSCAPETQSPPVVFTIPLDDGQLNMRKVMFHLHIALELDVPELLAELDWQIYTDSPEAEHELLKVERVTGQAVLFKIEKTKAEVTCYPEKVQSTANEVGQKVPDWLINLIELFQRHQGRRYGITFPTDTNPYASITTMRYSESGMPTNLVLLIHGLDDPGWYWRDMLAALDEENHQVARFEYPNDGPIVEAAELLALSLMDLQDAGVEEINIVAHSMGGLVTREVLTRRVLYDGDGTGRAADGLFPAVDRFIMIGTPNHGSKLARLRAVAEMKEQLSRAFSGEGQWLGSLSDGAGEAAEDLMPGSAFLSRLNRRPLATSTRYTIIAGQMSPIDESSVSSLTSKARALAEDSDAPDWFKKWIAKADKQTTAFVDEVVRGMGDGCVTIDSAQLDGVNDFIVLEANHVSLIVNLLPEQKDVPPAIPVVLDRLADEDTPVP